jgi:hypothetical protein
VGPAVALAVALAACSGGARQEAPAGLGAVVAPGRVKALLASADGRWLAWLDGCVEVQGRFLPPGTASCDLQVAPSSGGAPVRVARAVTTLPQGAGFAPEGGALAALADYDYEAGAGTLVLVRDGAPREVARGVTFHAFVPAGGGALLAVAGGRLLAVAADGSSRAVPGADGVATFDLARGEVPPGGLAVLARRPASAGGGLLAMKAGLEAATPVAAGTSEYAFAPRGGAWGYTAVRPGGAELFLGRGATASLAARGARTFAFAADGSAAAWISEAAPGRQGDLHAAAPGSPPALLGREVGEYRWAARAARLAWLERYDPRSRSGVLGLGGPGAAPRTFGGHVTDFEISADGAWVAFLRHTTDRGYSVDLELAGTAAPAGQAPRRVARGVFGFGLSPDARWLYYRTRCTRNAEACDLERVPTADPAAPPVELAKGVKSFELDPRDPERLLVTWQRADLVALDVALWEGGALRSVDQGALPGSVRFLGPDSRRLAYAVVQPRRAGVYVADLSRAPPAR